jgi:hypothetical protein
MLGFHSILSSPNEAFTKKENALQRFGRSAQKIWKWLCKKMRDLQEKNCLSGESSTRPDMLSCRKCTKPSIQHCGRKTCQLCDGRPLSQHAAPSLILNDSMCMSRSTAPPQVLADEFFFGFSAFFGIAAFMFKLQGA